MRGHTGNKGQYFGSTARRGLRALAVAVLAAALTASGSLSARPRIDKDSRDIEARLLADIRVLASDDFDGRKPGTKGETKTLHYLGKEWFDIGLVSGTNDPGNEWFAPVTLLVREPAVSTARFWRKGRAVPFDRKSVLALTWGKRAMVSSAPLLFVGHGQGAELTRAELAGRVALLLDGDGTDGSRQNMLLQKGAAAVLTVLDGHRTLADVAARRERSGYALADEGLDSDIEAYATREGVTELLAHAGLSLQKLEAKAAAPGFVPRVLDIAVSLEATTTETTIHTHNLIGKLPGRDPSQGAVLFLAHWDHFGECAAAGAPDRICNGAVDNASGVAALTEVARQLARGPQLDRDIYFMATTGEESGLLGAHAFADNPPIPLDRFVAAFNIDSPAIAPHGTPFAIVGRGMTALDPEIEKVAKAQKVKIVQNNDANEYVRRQDGWALLQHDVPAVMVTTAYGELSRLRAFFEGPYHRPIDDVAHLGPLGGAADDTRMLTALGRWFGDAQSYSPTTSDSVPASPATAAATGIAIGASTPAANAK
ncbi:M28 family metallopeptidase [Novosphingobium sp. 9]|uniref:M28 family metallopeptidase n=1 Tax=Novosphingobium sp. 9 TaxID=2025349 RepID=UPI0021B65905|nr:M28 family peptidase [Novosphingobium sp. 9]